MAAKSLPYRPCAGVMLVNPEGHIWVGRRVMKPAGSDRGDAWQMPQGGIDHGEAPRAAALRELYEETSIRSVNIIAESADWLTYDLPASLLGSALKGRYRGQRQKWFLGRFTGDEAEIDVATPGGGGHTAEFRNWKWVDTAELLRLIVPFKRPVYEALVAEFGPKIEALTEKA